MRKILSLVSFLLFVVSSNAQIRGLFEVYQTFDQAWLPSSLDTMVVRTIEPTGDGSGEWDTSSQTVIFFRNASGRIDSAWAGFRIQFANDTFSIDTMLVFNRAVGTHYTDSVVYIEENYNGSSEGWKPNYRISAHYRSGKTIDRWYSEYYQPFGGWDGQMTFNQFNYSNDGIYLGSEQWRKGVSSPFSLHSVMTRVYNGSLPLYDSIFYANTSTTTERGDYVVNGNVFTRLNIQKNSSPSGYILYSRHADNSLSKIEVVDIEDSSRMIFEFNSSSPTTGINEVQKQETVSVYPNPFNGWLNVQLPPSTKQTYTLIVTDITGKVMFNTSIQHDASTINTHEWPSGCYFYHINTNGNLQQHGKIIKP